MRRLSALALALTLSLTSLVTAGSVVAQTGCDPFLTPPEYDPGVPRFGFGETQMTVDQIDDVPDRGRRREQPGDHRRGGDVRRRTGRSDTPSSGRRTG